MHIVIPVFPVNDIEKELMWEKIEGEPLVSFGLKQLCMLKETKLFVVTDQERVVDHIRSLTITCDCVKLDFSQDLVGVFPPGASASLQYLLDNDKINKNNHIVVVDYRNPLITPDLIRKAYQGYIESEKSIFLSVAEVVDNPAQLDAYYRIVTTDVICLLDDDDWFQSYFKIIENRFLKNEMKSKINLSEMAVSKPFYFDWKSYGIKHGGATGVYARIFNEMNPSMVPVEETETAGGSPSFFFFANTNTACRLIPKNRLNTQSDIHIVGVSFLKELDQLVCVFISECRDSQISLYLNEEVFHNRLILRVWPFLNNDLINGNAENYHLSEEKLERMSKLTFFDSTYAGPIFSVGMANEVDGYIIAFLERIIETTADFAEPLNSEEKLWGVDPITKKRTNLLTGKAVMGRQDFPEVYTPDESFIIFDGNQIDNFGQMISDGTTEGFALDSSKSCKIESKIDLLRLKAQLRANKLST